MNGASTPAARYRAAAAHYAGVELGLGDHRPALGGHDEAVRQRGDAQRGFVEFRERRAGRQGEAVLGEVARHGLAPAGRFGGEQHAQARGVEEFLERAERILRAAIDGERGQWRRLKSL